MKRQREGEVVDAAAPTPTTTSSSPTHAATAMCVPGSSGNDDTSNNKEGVAAATTDTAATTGSTPSVDHIQWASYIKAHHQRIRDAMKATFGGDAQAAWNAMKQDEAALQRYATSMHHLATQYWDAPAATAVVGDGNEEGAGAALSATTTTEKFRYDDRVQYAVQCVQEYFIGPVAGNGVTPLPSAAAQRGHSAGAASSSGEGAPPAGVFLPMAVTMALKQEKRRFYAEHRCPMPDTAQREWAVDWLSKHRHQHHPGATTRLTLTALDVVWSAYCNMYESTAPAAGTSGAPPPPRKVRFLDVGSCYAPFEGKALTYFTPPLGNEEERAMTHQAASCGGDGSATTATAPTSPPSWTATRWHAHAMPMDVVSVDLAPYHASSVLACDWLDVDIRQRDRNINVDGGGGAKRGAESLQPPAAMDALILDDPSSSSAASSSVVDGGGCRLRRVVAVAAASFDVVTFSLVLSYMPSPSMRYDACRRAHAVLRDFGLLVVISTRTQGPRQASWVNDWVDAIESIGFVRVHKSIHCRLIGLTFQKKPRAVDATPTDKVAPSGGGIASACATLPPLDAKATAMAAKMVITADTL